MKPIWLLAIRWQRAAGRVAGQVLQVERLGDHALAREGGVAVDEDGERAPRIVVDLGNLVVGLDRAGLALDDRVDVLEVARIRREPHRDLARLGVADALGAEVVLHVAGAALGIRPDRLEQPFALELAHDHVVGPADGVREDVQPAAVGHADDDVAGAVLRGELDRLVEHRDHRVEPFDGELLLAEERAAQIALHALDLGQPPEQHAPLVLRREACGTGPTRSPSAATRAPRGSRCARSRRPSSRSTSPADAGGRRRASRPGTWTRRTRGGDLGLELGREPRLEALGLERGISGRLAAERVEARGEVAVHAMRLDERHRGGDRSEELRAAPPPRRRGSSVAAVGGARVELADALDDRARLELLGRVLEERTPRRVDRLGRSQVLLEKLLDEA